MTVAPFKFLLTTNGATTPRLNTVVVNLLLLVFNFPIFNDNFLKTQCEFQLFLLLFTVLLHVAISGGFWEMFFYTVVVCRSPCDCIIFCFCAEQTLHGLIHCLKNLNVQTSQTCKMLKEVGVYFQNNQTGLVLKEETSICMCCVILVLTPEQC